MSLLKMASFNCSSLLFENHMVMILKLSKLQCNQT